MSDASSNPQSATASAAPPVSSFGGPIAELICQNMLSPPPRPGLLATLDRFEILRVLGAGGMGIVLLGRDSDTGRNVAIKLVKPELVANPEIRHRFVKEAGHMQKLRHRSVMPVLEVSDRAQGPYFVMPYFENGSLGQRIKLGQPMATAPVLDVALQIADGLHFAHKRGIIHRDLKPANILLAADGQACLADFGLARTMFNDTIVNVEQQQCEGTAAYMSPAVAAGNAEDTRCDIYAFGALLYEMLTGDPPYIGRNAKDIRQQILAGPPKPIAARNPKADGNLAAVAEGAMARELRHRYADMADVLTDLQRIRDGKAVIGPRDSARKLSPMIWIPGCLVILAAVIWFLRPTTTSTPAPKPSPPPPVIVPAPIPVPQLEPPQTTIITLAGLKGAGGSADGTRANARFLDVSSVAVDSAGNVYAADTGNHAIRKITPDGVVTTLAGIAGKPGKLDGAGTDARFTAPSGIAVDGAGNLYVAEFVNNEIRKIAPDGLVTTLAGLAQNPGSTDGMGINAQFRNPWSVAVDNAGDVIVADMSNCTIRKIAPDGRVTTLAGLARSPGSADGSGLTARFYSPHGVAADNAGNVFVADTANHTIRKITAQGKVSTLAGLAGTPGNLDGTGSGARFFNPQGIAVDNTGNVYVADTDNFAIRKITPGRAVSTLAQFQASRPAGVAVDAAGNVYVADTGDNVVLEMARPPRP